MKWIFLSLLAANLAYLAFGLLWTAESPTRAGPVTGERRDLVLLSERTGVSGRAAEVEAVLENPVKRQAPEISGACLGLGAFENINDAQDVAERLDAVGYSGKLTAVDTRTGENDYRVVMPPFNSLQEAFRKLRELKSRNIDSYVITQGGDAQGISLGVFSSLGAATSHQATLESFGYTVEVKEIPRAVREYWIRSENLVFPEPILAEVRKTFPEVVLNETSCTD